MRPVSERFLAALHGSHAMSARARIVTSFQEGTDPTGDIIPVLGGDVRMEARADVRSTLQLETDGTRWDPRPGGDITPYGDEVFVERGIVFEGGSVEWCSLGYHMITDVEQDRVPDGPLAVTAADRMKKIIWARLVLPRQFAAGASIQDVIADLVGDVYPSATIEYDFEHSDYILRRSAVVERDRYKFLREMVTSRGRVMFWDHRGVLQVRLPPDPTVPVWEVNAGQGGVLVAVARRLNTEGVFNGVVAEGQGADQSEPVKATAVDANPASPTYWYGENEFGRTFGQVPRFYSSPLIQSVSQARQAAASLLRRTVGLPHVMDLSVVPNVGLEPLDPIRVRPPGSTQIQSVDSLRVPLTSGQPMAAATRETTGLIVGEDV